MIRNKKDLRVVYKYVLPIGGKTVITGWFTKILTVQKQGNNIVLWAENSLSKYNEKYDTFFPREERDKIALEIDVIGTGWDYENQDQKYIGTVQMDDGLVWHVYARPIQ